MRVLRVDQDAGIVDISPSELRTREERVVRLDHEAGRAPPRDGSLEGAINGIDIDSEKHYHHI